MKPTRRASHSRFATDASDPSVLRTRHSALVSTPALSEAGRATSQPDISSTYLFTLSPTDGGASVSLNALDIFAPSTSRNRCACSGDGAPWRSSRIFNLAASCRKNDRRRTGPDGIERSVSVLSCCCTSLSCGGGGAPAADSRGRSQVFGTFFFLSPRHLHSNEFFPVILGFRDRRRISSSLRNFCESSVSITASGAATAWRMACLYRCLHPLTGIERGL